MILDLIVVKINHYTCTASWPQRLSRSRVQKAPTLETKSGVYCSERGGINFATHLLENIRLHITSAVSCHTPRHL